MTYDQVSRGRGAYGVVGTHQVRRGVTRQPLNYKWMPAMEGKAHILVTGALLFVNASFSGSRRPALE